MSHKIVQKQIGGLDVLELPGEPNRGAIVLLHGFGADAQDLASISQVYPGPTWIFPQGPLEIPFSQNYTGRAWFPINVERLSVAVQQKQYDAIAEAFPFDLDTIRTTVDNFLSALDMPRSHIMLGGFSQGAVLAVETALHSPLSIGGLLIFSGTLIHAPMWRKLAPLHTETKYFQSHGADDPLLPFNKAQDLAHLLEAAGMKGEFHTFPGGHDIPPTILKQLTHFLTKYI